jgi:hypothetical protein
MLRTFFEYCYLPNRFSFKYLILFINTLFFISFFLISSYEAYAFVSTSSGLNKTNVCPNDNTIFTVILYENNNRTRVSIETASTLTGASNGSQYRNQALHALNPITNTLIQDCFGTDYTLDAQNGADGDFLQDRYLGFIIKNTSTQDKLEYAVYEEDGILKFNEGNSPSGCIGAADNNICVTTSTDNSTQEEDAEEDNSAEVLRIQKLITQMMLYRSNLLLGSQPDLIDVLSVGENTLSGSGNEHNGRFNLSTNITNPIWARIKASWSVNGAVKNRYVHGSFGLHHVFTPNFAAGLMLEMDYYNSKEGNLSNYGRGWLIGPYVVLKSPEHPIYLDARVLWGESHNKLNDNVNDFKTERFLSRIKIAGDIEFDHFIITPNIIGAYTSDKQEQFINANNLIIPEQKIEIGELTLGIDLKLPIEVNTGNLVIDAGFNGIYSYHEESNPAISNSNIFERWRGRFDLGFEYQLNELVTVEFSSFYDGIGSADARTIGLDALFSIKF